jgi:hypothetical protein
LLPGLQQVLTSGSGSFGGMRGAVDIVAIDVDGVEGLHNFTPGDPARDDIGGMDGIRVGRIRMRAIGTTAWLGGLGREMVTLEHTLNGSQTGRGLQVAATPLLLNGAGSHQGKAQTRLAVSHQELAQADDASLAFGRELIGMMEGGVGRRAKASPRMLVVILNPFVDPAATAVELSRHFRGRDTGSIAFDGGSAKLGVFVIRSCVAGHNSPPVLR